MPLASAIDWFVAITLLIIGLSHIVWAADWADAFRRLHQAGRAGAFVNGALSLIPGAIILAGHRVWTFPGIVITVFGCLLLLKSAICFLAPDKALRSMQHGANSSKSFYLAGGLAIAIAAWCAWLSA
jgi:hypothetical protein